MHYYKINLLSSQPETNPKLPMSLQDHTYNENVRLLLWAKADCRKHMDKLIAFLSAADRNEDQELFLTSLKQSRQQDDWTITDLIISYAKNEKEALTLFEVLDLPETPDLSRATIQRVFQFIENDAVDPALKEAFDALETAENDFNEAVAKLG